MTPNDIIRANVRILCDEYTCGSRGNLLERCRLDNYTFCPNYSKNDLDIHSKVNLSDKLEEYKLNPASKVC